MSVEGFVSMREIIYHDFHDPASAALMSSLSGFLVSRILLVFLYFCNTPPWTNSRGAEVGMDGKENSATECNIIAIDDSL